jgi:hypothetical protein
MDDHDQTKPRNERVHDQQQRGLLARLPKLHPAVPFVLAALLSAPLGAGALAVYRYPGTMCRWYDVVGNDTFFTPSGQAANGLKNSSASSKFVTCPLLMNDGTTTGAKIDQANFFVSNTSLTCRIGKRGLSGGAVGWYDPTSIEGSAFVWLSGNSYFDCTGGTCSMYCEIPGSAVINSYAFVPE